MFDYCASLALLMITIRDKIFHFLESCKNEIIITKMLFEALYNEQNSLNINNPENYENDKDLFVRITQIKYAVQTFINSYF